MQTYSRNSWPLQRNAVAFYGDPYNATFARLNIVQISVPWKFGYAGAPMSHISVHRKCADAFSQWFAAIWKNAGQDQNVINAWGMNAFSGSFVVRAKRGGSTPSMHSFGCAMDWDAGRNGFKDHTPNFSNNKSAYQGVVVPFKALGGTWGGDWPNNTDGMHFQFANVA